MPRLAQAPEPEVALGPLQSGLDKIKNDIVLHDGGFVTATTPQSIVQNIVLWLFGISAVVALLVLVVAGFTYILSFGDEERAKNAKKMALYAILGLLLAAGSFFILSTVRSLLGA